MDILYLIVGLLAGAALVYFLLTRSQESNRRAWQKQVREAYQAKIAAEQVRVAQTYEEKLHAMEMERVAAIKQARRDSTDQSRAVLKGKMAEQIAPLLPGFNYWPADARFLGDPIDYVVFNGYSGVKDNGTDGDDLEVVILDIKKGRAGLTRGQRQIARAVEEGRVRFEIVRIFEDGTVKSHAWRARKRKSSSQVVG
ncbi:MAG: endonuclease [Anaerolineae bacterium]|nr:endonuclease [Anaerolineae bacterium]